MSEGSGQIDLLVVGGGINGAGIARDAAGRGLSVTLCEAEDLGHATSSASTKLIHGGLRYLEYYEFRLVREALIEREVLLEAAPHIIWPLRFVLPHESSLRPAWMVRLGLFLYDHLGGRKRLPGSRSVNLSRDSVGAPLKSDLRKAFEYSDCWVEDSRLVVLNAMDAAARGARVLTRTRCVAAWREGGIWLATLQDADGSVHNVSARAIVNAAGPWVTEVLGKVAGVNKPSGLRLVKGSHLVVPKLYDGDQAYIFQNDDRRIVFVIPYEGDFSLVGTTDEGYEGDPGAVAISPAEADYICRAINRYLRTPISPEQAVWSYSGVRPLYDDASANVSAVTRDYVFDVDAPEGQAALLSIFGGKITTYRKLAEHAMEKLRPHLGFTQGEWTKSAVLPGGDMPGADFNAYLAARTKDLEWLPGPLLRRYLRAYGTRVDDLLSGARRLSDLGEDLGGGLYRAEVDYLRRAEWAMTADDILWRRSKLGLHVPDGTEGRLTGYLDHARTSPLGQAAAR